MTTMTTTTKVLDDLVDMSKLDKEDYFDKYNCRTRLTTNATIMVKHILTSDEEY